jgi:SM-20-related protein
MISTGSHAMESKPKADCKVDNSIIDFGKLRAATLNEHPFSYLIGHNTIKPEWENRLISDFPRLHKGGSFPLSSVEVGTDFRGLIQEMSSPEFREVVEEKFSLNLRDRPTIFTVRGRCRLADGKIHTDTASKIITVLLYMNPKWADEGGKLRILNGGTDINDFAAEVQPTVGTLLIFKRCDYSFHGHLPFEGTRKVIQMNWVTEQRFVDREAKRHRWSALIKGLPSLWQSVANPSR